MRINSKYDLSKRVNNAITALSKDGRYPESLVSLKNAKNVTDINDLEEAKSLLSDNLYDDDIIHPMHPEVAGLLTDIYLDGIEKGDSDYMCKLGSLYYSGRAGKQDYVKAAEYYHMAEKRGNEQAAEKLGDIYYYGKTGEKDYMKAFNYFVKGATTGNVRSLYKVGDFYRNGFYVEKDPKEAFHIYERCTEMITEELNPEVGADVYMRMGDCYHEGIGVEKDLILALSLMCSSEGLIYRRLKFGDFYQQNNLKHVLATESRIREEIRNELIPVYLSWADSQVDSDDTTDKKEPENADGQENNDAKNKDTEKNVNSETATNVFFRIRKDWDKILEDFKKDYDLLQVQVDTWLKPLRLFDLTDNELLIIVPAKDYAEILKKKYSRLIKAAIEIKYDIPLEIRYITEPEAKKLSAKNNTNLPIKNKKDYAPLGYNNAAILFQKSNLKIKKKKDCTPLGYNNAAILFQKSKA